MRRPKTIEGIVVMYAAYFLVTLYFSPKLFVSEKSDLYDALRQLAPEQNAWEIISLFVVLMYVISFFIKHWISRIIANTVGGAFFMLICVTYMFTYPNISGGIFLFVSIYAFKEVYLASNEHEDKKTQRQKKKLCDLERNKEER